MKTRTKSSPQVLFIFLLATMLAACGPRTKLVAPEIEPSADLIPGYVPEGFELVKGYQINPGDFGGSRFFADAEDCEVDARPICDLHLSGSFFDLQSPAGNDILGIHYQDGDNLLLITKSYYPGGSLELWRAAYEASDQDHSDYKCSYLQFVLDMPLPPLPLRFAEIQEVRTVGETQVAILDGALGLMTVFVRGDYLLTVEIDISLEENLKIVASLLGN
jgi:hypothetical protein